ncbi:MAG: ATP-binding cassette domain-containing protein [Lactobacillales bacterium]|jgi:ABC-type ATPase involved in cell division|nr:ATP-binding cassette domain-containing protein [Lactobacillales bacterium]
MIQLQEVVIQSLSGRDILVDVTQTFPSHKTSYVIGKSGEGKSTLLKAIFGELPVISGKIELDNEELIYDSLQSVLSNRRKIGFIFQDFRLIESLTVFENIAYVLHIQNESSEKIKKQVQKIAYELGIEKKLNNYCDQISIGEQQRVAIARALIKEPSLILADEPTGNLDPIKAREIMNIINETSLKRNVTAIVVTHDYALIPKNEKNIYKIQNMKIQKVEKGERYESTKKFNEDYSK